MKSFGTRFLRFCPKTGKLVGFKTPRGLAMLLMPLVGLLAMAWIIYRVATKPSRITYPCVRAAMPIASSLIGYVVFLAASLGLWAKTRKQQTAPAMIAMATLTVVGLFVSFTFVNDPASAVETQIATNVVAANQPMGTAVGIFPGRVVWVYRPDATNQNCKPDSVGHEWYLSENNNAAVVDTMMSTAIQRLTGTTTDSSAWSAIFRFHNTTRGKGAVGYAPGEKVFVKINCVSTWDGQFSTTDLSYSRSAYNKAVTETSPDVVLSMLRQLVNVVGVAQTDIYVGDPMRHIYKHNYDLWHTAFPNVHYLDYSGYTTLGREKVVKSTTAVITFSDKGSVLKSNGSTGTVILKDSLYTIYENAEYLINLPMLKGHRRAGMTMFAKDHFGSHTRSSASHLHGGLVSPEEYPNSPYRSSYGMYRVQVDFMAHSLTGKKNLLYFMDALWSTDYELDIPLKWRMAPFNNRWMSSVFASLDPVAIESVGYDFLRSEFTTARGAGTYVQQLAVDDYLHQAADSANWPVGVRYDPDNTGTYFASLGTHEHWNDSLHMQYTRNLGTGNGIELIKEGVVTSVPAAPPAFANQFVLDQNYPNPFNPTTEIRYFVPNTGQVRVAVYDVTGREVAVLADGVQQPGSHIVRFNAAGRASGIYFCRMTAGSFHSTMKMVLAK